MSSSTPLTVERLGFSHPQRHVFAGWSQTFAPGLTWLRGSNGTGKSTLLKLLAGALPAASGVLSADGLDIAERPLDYRRAVFWCGPGPVPFEHLSPNEYFGFMRSVYPRFDVDALAAQARGFGLAPHLTTPLRALSTGTQRKTWIAAALAAGTRVTLLDEPFNALDAASHAYLADALTTLWNGENGRACIVASHEPPAEAGRLAAVCDLQAMQTADEGFTPSADPTLGRSGGASRSP